MVTRKRHFVVSFFVGAVMLMMIIASAIFFSAIAPNENMDTRTIFVLGCSTKDGYPEAILEERLKKAIEVGQQNPDATIYVSGGYDKGENTSEGDVMKNYLINQGVSNKIVVESQSTSTYENFQYTLGMMDSTDNICVVTSDYHSLRVGLIMARFDVNGSIVKSSIPPSDWVWHWGREILANIKTFFVDW